MEYSEIPGVYSERPRPFIGIRRWIRTYRTPVALFTMLVLVLCLASGLSILISSALIGPEEPPPSSPANQSLVHLMALPFPRRDEHWYEARWTPTMQRNTSKDEAAVVRGRRAAGGKGERDEAGHDRTALSDPDSEEWTKPDGSTFPANDTWHWNRHPDHLPRGSEEDVSEALAAGTRAQEAREQQEEQLARANITLRRKTADYKHQHGFRKTSPLAINMAKLGYAFNHATAAVSERLALPRSTVTFDLRWLADLKSDPHCDPALSRPRPPPCPAKAKYRTYDGSCNNLHRPTWGASFTAYRRMMPPDYVDGISIPRRGVRAGQLPSARQVSLEVHTFKRAASQSYTVLAMTWGQFVDHDITLTAQSKGSGGQSIACCTEEVTRNKTLRHPECFPIPLSDSDPLYKGSNSTCLEFTRSAPAPKCKFGPREQLNQQTSYLDASAVYGATPEAAKDLRMMKDGLLKTQVVPDGRELLPPSLDPLDGCNKAAKLKYNQSCFLAGDPRANEQVLLTSLHTILVRQHNTLAIDLKDLNPSWQDEQLFQEARRILVAQLQHITYQEYVPSVLGPRFMRHLHLSPKTDGQHTSDYNPRMSASIANEFAAAAYRFGHSQIQGLVRQVDGARKNINFGQLSSITFNPFSLYVNGEMARYLRGETSQKAAAVDTYFSPQVTGQLFRGKAKTGIDLVAINIQRGRDHGVPAYTRARMACGLPRVHNFTELATEMDTGALAKIAKVYRHVDEIDLYTGGLAERPIEDGLVGPTFACILADQFLRLKKGDRYWYETKEGPQAFSEDQLAEIHKSSLARLLCDNVPELFSVQRWPLRVYATGNPRLPCSSLSIPKLNLDPWEVDPL
ncbi:peroxidase-like [Portunus trituberculatus]|uniref:peroxidase-like n=1 Tax=Portunus trituberculatus TaxID=210409 RepID=UPI001E1CE254|nr:peroxidase-like [Portunus trituberculatus]